MKSLIFTSLFVLLLVIGLNAKAVIPFDGTFSLAKYYTDNEVDTSNQIYDQVSTSLAQQPVEDEETIDLNTIEVDEQDREEFEIYKTYENLKRNINYNADRYLDVYYDKNDSQTKKPVVIYIYGGSWVTGNKIRYTKFGVLLEQKGYVGVIPNYILYPNGSVEEMVEDIYKTIQWTYQNISKYGGNPEKIILTAHSAGAHISALTIVKSALQSYNNGVQLQPLPYLERVVLMNGPYILNKELVGHSIVKGTVNFFSGNKSSNDKTDKKQASLLPKFLLKYYNDNKISPIAILRQLDDNSIPDHFNVGKFVFFYTSKDNTVPESSAKNLIYEITRTSPISNCRYVYREGLEHATVIFGIRDNDPYYENIYLDLISGEF
ncbi:hypothetical protein BCR32DRAFT_326475 [Anaeromyces robustus]|uniref:BD-FAE-like domain-containing protein n=1 Tax=Anaeromyces robustus TaxID=1754192 RepID=A0A1Y1XCX4_9FUNG|nr:hypothetical protein BCR32DRAFT_326475 [Anaeromyces robustus]|eukprot:ORX83224.1 hypothetical protein BCR32DRAFT_326475 [Anaeromyces robustus]